MNCGKCGQETIMPFRCPYCGNQFCSEHRLPESHDCRNLIQARAQKQEYASSTVPSHASYEYKFTFGQTQKNKGRIYFSPKELKHLAIGAFLVLLVGFSYGIGSSLGQNAFLILSSLAIILTVSFFTHEIAHKITAQRCGLWSEFRLTTWGMLMTLFTMFLPFKLISPGAVMVSGSAKMSDIGKTSIAGPITNIILSAIFLFAATIPSYYSVIFVIGALINAYIAVFNLIPFGILDGLKIYNWNKMIWLLVFAIAVALAIPSYLLYMGYF